MAASRNAHPTRDRGTPDIGLLANGYSGPWEIAIDETTTGPVRWFAQIEGPSVAFYFEIPSIDIVTKMLAFLESQPGATKAAPAHSGGPNGSLAIGNDKKTPVSLVKDDEYPDR
jgi:hypothetical protein